MIDIGIAYPTDPLYEDISRFAREVYHDRIQLTTTARPNFFAYAKHSGNVVGCMGLYLGDTRPEMFFEMCKPPQAYERLSGLQNPDRSLLGEIGTRVIVVPGDACLQSLDISISLTAALVITAYEAGVRYVGFITNRLVHRITDPLGFHVLWLGEPDFSHKSTTFQKNMAGFMRAKQYCAGFPIGSLEHCEAVLTKRSRA